MRRLARQIIKRGLQYCAAYCLPRKPGDGSNSLTILMYHRVLPVDHPDNAIMQPGMVVSDGVFRLQLQILQEQYTLVDLDDWVERARTGKELPARACAVTFDDGWIDNYYYAFPILKELGCPATIYLATDFIGSDVTFWPERVARLLWNEGRGLDVDTCASECFDWLRPLVPSVACFADPDLALIDSIIGQCKRYDNQQIVGFLERSEQLVGHIQPVRDIMSWDQVKEMQDTGLVRFGSHTRSHHRFQGDEDNDKLAEEIVVSQTVIEQKLGVKVTSFTYPNGDITAPAKDLIQAQYSNACSVVRGINTGSDDLYALKRLSIHEGATADRVAFLAKLSGRM